MRLEASGSGTLTASGATGGPFYRRTSRVAVAADGSVQLQSGDDAATPLSANQRDLLRHCGNFRSLAALRRLPGFAPANLDALVSRGLVESDAEILSACASMATGEPLPPISDQGILGCAAPEMLLRSVRSWTKFARHHHRDLHLTVLDDSPDDESANAQREAAGAAERERGEPLRFIDPVMRASLAAAIARHSGTDPALAQFAVAGSEPPRVGIGGNRNLLNLLTRGRRVLCADDDILAEFVAPAVREPALWILSDEVPVIPQYFESIEEIEQRLRTTPDYDAVALHEEFVGNSVANVVARLQGPVNLFGARPELTDAMQNRPVCIAASSLGLAGDSASDCAAFFSLLATGEAEKNLFARPVPLSPSRETLRLPHCPVLCQGVYFMTYCHAVDNRLPLPPYFPVGRGEDQVWQKLLHATLPNTVVAHLPLAVRHRPGRRREYSRADYLDPCASFPGNAFLLGAIDACGRLSASEPDQRLGELGERLGTLLRTRAEFTGHLRGAWTAYLRHHFALVDSTLATRPENPRWWQQALAEIRARLESQLADTALPPLDYGRYRGEAAIDPMWRDVQTFARLLQAWPAIRLAAADFCGSRAADPDWLRPGDAQV